jgi:plasmid rolling circle replication initiator protein Rep
MMDNRTEKENSQLEDEVLADASPEGSQEKRLARYAAAKTRQGQVSDYILKQTQQKANPHLEKVNESLKECGSFLVFRHYFTLDVFKLVSGVTCKKHLLCALCAIRRAAKCIAVYSEKISQVRAEQITELDELMITFTVKNGEDLQERFDHLLSAMGKILHKRRSSLLKNPRTTTEMKHISGAVYSYEVTYSEDDGFHPHCHMIALVPQGAFEYTRKRIKKKDVLVPLKLWKGIVEDWKAITGDSYIIDVRKIENVEMPLPGEEIKGTRLAALIEVFKYALKMNRISKDHETDSQENVRIQVEAYQILRGRRMIGSFGSLFGVKVPENLNDQPLTDAELPYVDLVYQYSGVNFGYQLTTHSEARTGTEFPSKHHAKDMLKKLTHNYSGEKKWKEKVKEYVDLQTI